MGDYSIDKRSFSVTDLRDSNNDTTFWREKPPEERFGAIEMMRRINYGKDVTSRRLQRVFEVAESIRD